MPKFWLISNRSVDGSGFGTEKGEATYWISERAGLDQFKNWKKTTADDFKTLLAGATDQFPALEHAAQEDQRHLTIFVHGFNNSWQDAARRYEKLCGDLFAGKTGLGICVSFDWPSFGSVLGYYPDRAHARDCAGDLANVLTQLYDWLLKKQQEAIQDEKKACKAKISMIAHSMGSYVMQKAMATAWARANQPLLASLINQLVMVAADIDNNIFEPQADDASDGNALANLTYRITSLYSGRDAVLGTSAGLKHFGSRRLGRSGLPVRPPTGKDNIWDTDCSGFFPAATSGTDVHSAYFDFKETVALIREILRGVDRTVLEKTGLTKGTAWP